MNNCMTCKHVSVWTNLEAAKLRTAYCMVPMPTFATLDHLGASVTHHMELDVVAHGNTPVVNCPAWEPNA